MTKKIGIILGVLALYIFSFTFVRGEEKSYQDYLEMVKKRKDSPLNEEEWNKWQIELKSAKEKKGKADAELKKEVELIARLARQWDVKDEEGHMIDDYIKGEDDSEEFPTVGVRMKIIALAAKDCRENAGEFKRKYPQIWKSGSVLAIEDFAGDGRKEVLLRDNITTHLKLHILNPEGVLTNNEDATAFLYFGEESSNQDPVDLIRENGRIKIKTVHLTRPGYDNDYEGTVRPLPRILFKITRIIEYDGKKLNVLNEKKEKVPVK